MTVRVKGQEEFERRVNKLANNLGADVATSLLKVGEKVRENAVKSIQDVSPGAEVIRYTAGGNKKKHIASKPGDAPNTDTGRLVGSIFSEPNERGTGVVIGTEVSYGKDLEFGTKKTAARPWLRPALRKAESSVKGFAKEAIQKALRSLGK